MKDVLIYEIVSIEEQGNYKAQVLFDSNGLETGLIGVNFDDSPVRIGDVFIESRDEISQFFKLRKIINV
jgi:hypothetical protein